MDIFFSVTFFEQMYIQVIFTLKNSCHFILQFINFSYWCWKKFARVRIYSWEVF